MMAATQPFSPGAISKTVNMPNSATVGGHRRRLHPLAGKAASKALAIYRDGSKTAQALRTDAQKDKEGSGSRGGPENRSRAGYRKTTRSPTSSRSAATRGYHGQQSTPTARSEIF